MRSLFRFLVRNYFFLLFLMLEVVCFILVIRCNNYQNASFYNSSNRLVALVYASYDAAAGYFGLRQSNEQLAAENARLKYRLQQLGFGTKTDTARQKARYRFIPARIINNSVNRQNNYLTLNKGRKDGVKPDMGIVCSQGIVGLVSQVSDHYATGPSLLNKRWRISAKIKKNGYFGSLVWEGRNECSARLNEIPFHVELSYGDTIVTSGYSSIFPEGILIGRIEQFTIGNGENFYEIHVRLSANFRTLSLVEIIEDGNKPELDSLQKTHLND
ncbi:MAG: rod shape-determining protein MreC [Mangrovibacterium sp.]